MVCDQEAAPRRNVLESLDADSHASRAHKEDHASDAGSVEESRVAHEERVEQEQRAREQDVESQEYGNKCGANHSRRELSRIPNERSTKRFHTRRSDGRGAS